MNFILDIDGTLWDTTEIVAEAWNDATEAVGLGNSLGRFITGDMLKKEFGKPMDEIIDDLYPNQDSRLKSEILIAVKKYESIAIRSCTADLAFPNVSDTCRMLCEAGHSLFIVSNCQEGYIELVMDILEIRDYISDYESFGVTGLPKSKNIELVCNRNKFAQNTTVYVGDTLGDYKATCEAGLPFVFASYGFGEMESDYDGYSISSFDELLSFFI